MPSRFEYERGVRRSSLLPPSRHLALTIATWANTETGVVPSRFTPSLSTLAEATGLDRSTVRRHLTKLEKDGWLVRNRPDPEEARTRHARTGYRLAVPVDADTSEEAGARGTQPPGLGAHSPQAGGTEPPGLGAENTKARGTQPPKQSSNPSSNHEGGKPTNGPRIAASCQPLVQAMTAAGIHVSWELSADEWFLLEAITKRAPLDVLIEHAIESWHKARSQPRSARYFLTAWRGMPETPDDAPRQPAPPKRHLQSVSDETPESRGIF